MLWSVHGIITVVWILFYTMNVTALYLPNRAQRALTDYVRLANGPNAFSGRVEIYHNRQWGTVCDDGFTDTDAQVVCRELGFSGGDFVTSGRFGSGTGEIWMDGVDCAGTENRLAACHFNGWSDHNCGHSEDVGVICSPRDGIASTVRFRLVNGPSDREGRLEVYYSGEWGTVCDDYFNDEEATVVCREMGYQEGEDLQNRYGQGSGEIWLDNVSCTGTEATVTECTHNSWGTHNCGHSEDVSVRCAIPVSPSIEPHEPAEENSVRLVGGLHAAEGRVEIYHAGRFGTICDDGWTESQALVVCRQLGYTAGTPVAMTDNQYGEGVDPIWLDDVTCTGSELRIDMCQHAEWGVNDCAHYEDVGVRCENRDEDTSPSQYDIALFDGPTPHAGRLEVYYNGVWKPVCNDMWSLYPNAQVACRQLGYEGGQLLSATPYGTNGEDFWLDNVECVGNEDRLADCDHHPWGIENCSPNEAISLRCDEAVVIEPLEPDDNNMLILPQVRLASGAYPWQGRVEIYKNSQWGTICSRDRSWGRSEARVVCRQLGYQHGEALVDLEYGEGSGAIHFYDVQCTGDEQHLLECSAANADAAAAGCRHGDDVAVECLNVSARQDEQH